MASHLMFLFLLMSSASAFAQSCDTTLLPLNTVLSASLSDQDCRVNDILGSGDSSLVDQYQFTLNAPSSTTISMSSTSVDSFLRLLSSNLTLLAQDDDSGTQFDALISAQLDSGTYILLANSATSSVEEGTYTISASTSGGSTDFDGDGLADDIDTDDDNDGVDDALDAFPQNAAETKDVDGDGIGDNADNSIQLASGNILSLPIVGRSLVSPTGASLTVPTNATAVSLNVTVVNPDTAGFVTVYPCGVERPLASNLNYSAGTVVPNGVIASLGIAGSVCFYSQARIDLIVDVAGWFEGDAYTGATPQRLVDTRDGTGGLSSPLVPPSSLTIQVVGLTVMNALGVVVDIPSSLSAVALNVTAVSPQASGFVTVYPCDAERPLASNLNFLAGSVIANGVIAPVSSTGTVCIYSSVATDLVVDLAGWFAGSKFTGAVPKRFVDSRSGFGASAGQLVAGGEVEVTIVGASINVSGTEVSIPSTAVAAVMNVVAIGPLASGFLTVYPCGVTRPLASNVNFGAGDVVANNVIAPIGSNGQVCVYSSAATHVVVDVSGYLTNEASGGFVPSTPSRFVDTRDGTGPKPE